MRGAKVDISKRTLRYCIGTASMLTIGLIASGCTSTSPAPTHRWVSLDNASGAEYRVENERCAGQSAGDSNQRVFSAEMPEYQKYLACMEAQGYALVTYDNDAEPAR